MRSRINENGSGRSKSKREIRSEQSSDIKNTVKTKPENFETTDSSKHQGKNTARKPVSKKHED